MAFTKYKTLMLTLAEFPKAVSKYIFMINLYSNNRFHQSLSGIFWGPL